MLGTKRVPGCLSSLRLTSPSTFMYTVGTTFTKYWNIMEAAGRRGHWAWVQAGLGWLGATSQAGTLGCSDVGVVQGVHNARVVLPE